MQSIRTDNSLGDLSEILFSVVNDIIPRNKKNATISTYIPLKYHAISIAPKHRILFQGYVTRTLIHENVKANFRRDKVT